MKEEWKEIDGFNGLYLISNYGRVKSPERIIPHWRNPEVKRRIRMRYLKTVVKFNGRQFVRLFNGKTVEKHYTDDLVAKHFLPNPENKTEIEHIDGYAYNSSVTNLKWK